MPSSKLAESVGSGVRRTRFKKVNTRDILPDLLGEEAPISGKKVEPVSPNTKWLETPTLAFQVTDDSKARLKSMQTLILNLGEAKDLDKWNELQTGLLKPECNYRITDADRQFCEKAESWKLMVTVSFYEFLDIMSSGKKPTTADKPKNSDD